jgi:hypothetical protein
MPFFNFFRRSPKETPPEVLSLTPDHFKYIWNHQLIVIQNDIIIDLLKPMFPINSDFSKFKNEYKKRFPFVVGDNGNLIGVSFVRCIFDSLDKQKNSIYLDYILSRKTKTRITLKISGNDPQSIRVTRDERLNNEIPVILFLAKISGSN